MPPPAVPQGRARRRGHRPQGAGRAPAAERPAARCSRRTPTPTRPPAASRSRWPWRWASSDVRPLEADRRPALDKIVVFAPVDAAERIRAALAEAGAGRDRRLRLGLVHLAGRGTVPAARRAPARDRRGRPGSRSVDEVRIETVCPRAPARPRASPRCGRPTPTRSRRTTWSSSPLRRDRDRGSGRIGRLAEPMTLREFAARVAAVLPETAHGVRVAGDPDQRRGDRRALRRGR